MRNAVYNGYNDVKAAHPDEIVLYQVGDFFELYGEDARAVADDLSLELTRRNLEGAGRVAETVEQLSANSFKGLVAMGCTAISFEAPNYLTAGGWQADFLPEQLNGLPQSEYFVDEQGVFYRIDSETNTASVFYCPPGIGTYTVPKELPAVDGKETPVPVTGVDSYAFSDASDLTALTFESPDAITTLADLAFYRAVNLASINGQSDSAAVLGTFTSDELKTGTMAQFREHLNITELERSIVVALIDRILIYKDNRVEVRFRFADEFAWQTDILRRSQIREVV